MQLADPELPAPAPKGAQPPKRDLHLFAGFGVGIGMHCFFESGFTIGFKSPLIGYSVLLGSSGLLAGLTRYYLSAALGLPLLSLGYGF